MSNQTNWKTTEISCGATERDNREGRMIKSNIQAQSMYIALLLSGITPIPAPVCQIVINYIFYNPKIIDTILGLKRPINAVTSDKKWNIKLEIQKCTSNDCDCISHILFEIFTSNMNEMDYRIFDVNMHEMDYRIIFVHNLYNMFWESDEEPIEIQNQLLENYSLVHSLDIIRNRTFSSLFQSLAKKLEAEIE